MDDQIQFLREVVDHFGEPYLTHILLPLFLVAVGDDADFKSFPPKARSKIRGNILHIFLLVMTHENSLPFSWK